jgi:hypothetical protein
MAAISALGKIGGDQAADEIAGCLQRTGGKLASHAIETLFCMGDARGIEPVAEQLIFIARNEPEQSSKAVRSLTELAQKHAHVLKDATLHTLANMSAMHWVNYWKDRTTFTSSEGQYVWKRELEPVWCDALCSISSEELLRRRQQA